MKTELPAGTTSTLKAHQDPQVPEIVIQANRRLLHLDLRALWQYRDLLLLLIRRDFLAKYKQTVLGPVWFIVQPLATTLIFTVVFSRIAKISTDGVPAPIFYLTGLLVWNYFQTAFSGVSGSLAANAGVFGKVFFPRLIPAIATTTSALVSVLIQAITWIVVYWMIKSSHPDADSFGITIYAVLFPLLLLQTAALAMGFGLLMASVTAKYRDLSFTMGFIMQAWLYLTPIIYPLSSVPEHWQWLAAVNPMTAMVEACRGMLLGETVMTATMYLSSLGVTIVALCVGVVVFNRVQRTFVDIL
ncbi:MAG: ABC transporter permease [Puniceicoccaceae bacterium]|nr:MAG: ABC transporter permease [Puniceicoccaceae bacterium]